MGGSGLGRRKARGKFALAVACCNRLGPASVVLPKCLARQAMEAYIGVYGYHNEEVETATG